MTKEKAHVEKRELIEERIKEKEEGGRDKKEKWGKKRQGQNRCRKKRIVEEEQKRFK